MATSGGKTANSSKKKNMIQITDTIKLDESEIQFEFMRASGPGGQNINKVATAVQLRFDVDRSLSLTNSVRQRLKKISGRRVTSEGVLIIKAQRCRTQERNRQDALNRLVALIQKAAEKPKHRRQTNPTWISKQRRLTTKRRRAEIKRHRQTIRNSKEDS